MNRRDVLRKASAGIAATVVIGGTASADGAGTSGTECRDGCYEHCSDSGGCYCIC